MTVQKSSYAVYGLLASKTSDRRRHNVEMYSSAVIGKLVTILTFHLWPWKRFSQFPLTWWISVASFIKSLLL